MLIIGVLCGWVCLLILDSRLLLVSNNLIVIIMKYNKIIPIVALLATTMSSCDEEKMNW
jgi:hypothetical protein